MSYYSIEGYEFAFKCPRQWEQLKKTDKDDKRFCYACERAVYLCDDPLLLELHAKAGHCVAVLDTRTTFHVGRVSVQYGPTTRQRDY